MPNNMWQRTKLVRRIIFYVLMLGYIVVHTATEKHDLLTNAIFAAIGVYAIAQLIEDISAIRHPNR